MQRRSPGLSSSPQPQHWHDANHLDTMRPIALDRTGLGVAGSLAVDVMRNISLHVAQSLVNKFSWKIGPFNEKLAI